MSNAITKRMINAYYQNAEIMPFLTGFFQSPPQNYHNSEEIELDIEREDEEIAIVVTDLSTGYRANVADMFTNKRMKPPIYKEKSPINAFDLIKREAGQNPFQDPNFQANAIGRAFKNFRLLEKKIRRAIELQAAQVLQTGTLTLRDSNGTALYTIDFQPKATHFPTSGTTWGQTGDDKLGDLQSLSNVLRADGKSSSDLLLFGEKAFESFIDDGKVQARLDSRNFSVGQVAPEMRGNGGTFQGFIWIGNYRFQMWTYDGRYKDPQTGNSTRFLDTGKVCMLSSQSSRLDLTFGSIPRIAPPESRALPFLPPRMSGSAQGMDLTTNAWLTEDGEQLFVSAGTRPLTIPTAIDTIGCLDTGLTE